MTTGDAAVTLASAGVLAQMGGLPDSIEGVLSLGFKGIMLIAVWALWVGVQRKDEAERKYREAERAERQARDKAEQEERERRDRLEQEREQALIELVKSMRNNG